MRCPLAIPARFPGLFPRGAVRGQLCPSPPAAAAQLCPVLGDFVLVLSGCCGHRWALQRPLLARSSRCQLGPGPGAGTWMLQPWAAGPARAAASGTAFGVVDLHFALFRTCLRPQLFQKRFFFWREVNPKSTQRRGLVRIRQVVALEEAFSVLIHGLWDQKSQFLSA